MKRIPLRARDGSVRAYALVDDDVFELYGGMRWSQHNKGYAYRQQPGPRRRNVMLHRLIMGLEHGDPREVDHENRDRLDCQRENLRVVPPGANAQNVAGYRGARSRFRGVSWHRRSGKWQAAVAGQHVGLFVDEIAAARAAAARRREVFPFAHPDPELERVLGAA